MSIADAVRARELEARVAAIEKRLAALEEGGGTGGHLAQRINLLQGQINLMRKSGANYRRSWNESLRTYSDRPLHDWASHATDAARYWALANVRNAGSRKK